MPLTARWEWCTLPAQPSLRPIRIRVKTLLTRWFSFHPLGQATYFWQRTQKIWTDSQCRNIAGHPNLDVDKCKSKCYATNGCTAVNYSPANGACVFRACSQPIPKPERVHDEYEGYYLKLGK